MTRPALRGIGWDHPRCSSPLNEAARQWRARGEGNIDWIYRSLSDFNSGGLPDLARDFDLLVIDHPMLPRDAALFHPLDAMAAARDACSNAIGASGTAYLWDGSILAVPIDVAAHVSASRPDLLDDLGELCPTDWNEVLDFAERHPGQVVASLTGDDAVCILLTIAASTGEPITADVAPAMQAVDLLVQLAARCPPSCTRLRPPEILELLMAGKAAYTPALFGYATYLRAAGSRLAYSPVPAIPHRAAIGVMGGAGLAVSAFTQHPGDALDFVRWICDPSVQGRVLVAGGGQPAATAVWDDPVADRTLGGFFSQTREATEHGAVRLLDPRWPYFQGGAARIFDTAFRENWPSTALNSGLAQLHAQIFQAEA